MTEELAQLLSTCYNWIVYKFGNDEFDDSADQEQLRELYSNEFLE